MKNLGTKKQPYLSVIIPAYNEEAVINDTLVDVHQFLLRQPYTSEIIVVNDGSTDKTAEIIKGKMQVMDNLRLVENDPNRGKGYTVIHGAKEAQGKFVLFTDADNATKIDEVNKFFPYFEQGYHIVIGSRAVESSNIKIKQPFLRRTLGRLANLLIQALVLPGLKDTQCGFKCFTNETAKAIFPKQVLSGWVFDMETLAIGRQLGFKIKEVGITWTDVSKTKMSFLKVYLKSVFDLLKVKWNLVTGKYRK